MKSVIRSVFKVGAIGAGAVLIGTGCAPVRDDAAPGIAGDSQMAVLTSDDSGFYDVSILDMNGNSLHLVDANLAEPVGLSYHPDDFFIVSQGYSSLLRVDMDGVTTPFTDQPIGTVYRTFVSGDDGTTTVSGEYDATRLDPEGEVIDTLSFGSEYCWMDSGEGPSTGSPAMLDVFGPTVAVWDTSAETFTDVATNVGYSSNILGSDESGTYYVGSSYDNRIWTISDQGETSDLGSLSAMGIDAYGVKALEPASGNSVMALVDSNLGSSIVEIDDAGNMNEITNAGGAVWLDMVVF